MGMAPRWGMWIEGMTEEMENEGLVVRDEYKFVTDEELEGVDHKWSVRERSCKKIFTWIFNACEAILKDEKC